MFPGRFHILFISILFILALSAWTAHADIIVLNNGTTITGKITGGGKGTLTISTDYSEPISVHTSAIKQITMEEPIKLRLKNGKILKGKLSMSAQGKPEIITSGGVPVGLNWDDVESFNPPPNAWSGTITAGANSQSGNTRQMNASIGANALWKAIADNISAQFLYNYAENSGKLSARNVFGSAKYEHLFTPHVYGYLDMEMLSDKFMDLYLRTVAGPGAGYQVWDVPSSTLSFEVGVSYFHEHHFVGRSSGWYTGRLAGTFLWNIAKAFAFSEYFVMYNRLDKQNNYTTRNEASITSALRANLALKVSNVIQYDRTPAPGIYKMDIFWILGLQYTF